jgi:DNA-binding CsgD family transcriptional regulator
MHHWILETPAGPLSRGVCKLCKEVKDFPNSDNCTGWTISRKGKSSLKAKTLYNLERLKILLSNGKEYTAQQLADELGISRAPIYDLIRENHLVWNKPERVYKRNGTQKIA